MQKKTAVLSVIFIMAFFAFILANTSPAFSADSPSQYVIASDSEAIPSIIYKGQPVNFQTPPIFEGDEIYLPVRDIGTKHLFEQMGYYIDWSYAHETLSLFSGEKKLKWKSDSTTLEFCGNTFEAEKNIMLKDGTVYIPVRALGKIIGITPVFENGNYVLYPLLAGCKVLESNGLLNVKIDSGMPFELNVNKPAKDNNASYILSPMIAAQKEINIEQGGVSVHVVQQGTDCILDVKFPERRKVEVSRSDTQEALITGAPDFPSPALFSPQQIFGANFSPMGENQLMTFKFSGTVQYFWRYDSQANKLYIQIPQVTHAPSASDDWKNNFTAGGELTLSKVGSQNMALISINLKEGTYFKIYPSKEKNDEVVVEFSNKQWKTPIAAEGFSETRPAGVIIVIDPGHGGSDPGAINWKSGLYEKNINLDIALKLRSELTALGWTVIMTRTEDVDVGYPNDSAKEELQARVDVAEKNGATIFISLHCNAMSSPNSRGSSIHWYKQEDYALAQSLSNVLSDNLGLVDRGLCRNQFYVLRHSSMPAVLIEMAFISNPYESSLLASEDFRLKIARALSLAINEFVKTRTATR
ncbi:MAG: N-acetylmuramoyl-L-alanine amidase [Firmicutes bacterium]|nr:N-acetylmuramoyl-L-alanine amidase [Bacillota bacterium]